MSKLLTLKRPTTISKLFREVHDHRESQPCENIPQWSDVPMLSKLPDRRCPEHSMDCSRGVLGSSIGCFPHKHEFDLQDPFMQVAPKDYHLLHDKYLRTFWSESMKKNLKHRGLIDEKERVLCTIEEFNQFRRFHYMQIRLNLHNRFCHEETAKKYLQHWVKIQQNLSNNDDFNEKLLIRSERAENILLEKLNRWKNNIDKYTERTKVITLGQNNEKQLRKLDGHRRKLLNNLRNQELEQLRKKKMLTMKRQHREQDASLQERILTYNQRNADIRSTMHQERFRVHNSAYTREGDEAKRILNRFLTEMQLKVHERKEKYRQQHTKLEEDLVHRKTQKLSEKYERRSKKALIRAFLRECKKGICRNSSYGTPSAAHQTIVRAIHAAYAIHTTMSHTTSSTLIIDTAGQFISDLREQSESEPLPLDKHTVGYVVDQLREMMEQILHTTVHQALELIEKVAMRKLERLGEGDEPRRSSLTSMCSGTKGRSGCAKSRVSMGPVSICEQYETESYSFKKCRSRPPTPVTSVTSLIEGNLRQPEEERSIVSRLGVSTDTILELSRRIHSENYPLIHVMHSQRRFLESNLVKYRLIVQPYVEQRVLAFVADLERLLTTTKPKQRTSDDVKDKLLHRTAIELLKFPDSGYRYANALFDSVHFLSSEAIRKIQIEAN